MKKRAVVAGGLLALAGGWAISAFGQGMFDQPAEYPPASYEGRQYVDSRGCVYIRAGIDGQVTWVPRVSRDRKVICDQVPTFTPEQLAALKGTSVSPTMPTAAPTPQPAPRMVASVTTPAPHPNVVNDIYVPGGGATDPAGSGTYVPGASMASGSVVNDIYIGSGTTTTYAPTTSMTASASSAAGSVVNDIFVPGGQATGGYGTPVRVTIPNSTSYGIPAGYRAAWDDDRLNPNRGPQSASGDASMYSVWTQETPMRLASSSGGGVIRGIRSVVPFISSKTAPVEPSSGGAGGYVQVGAFQMGENVSKNLGRLTRMGLPVAVQQVGNAQVVLAGPFQSGADLAEALAFLRANGYADAFRTN